MLFRDYYEKMHINTSKTQTNENSKPHIRQSI